MEKIPLEIRALNILKNYTGNNNYIQRIKNRYYKKSFYKLTKNEANYIIKNYKIEPTIVNKVFEIHKSKRSYFKNLYSLDFVPEKIFIEKLLSRKNKELHVWGRFDDDNVFYDVHLGSNIIIENKPTPHIDLEKYKNRPPLPHQIPGIYELMNHNKFILGWDMGLAKTSTAIIAAIERKFERILVVCPASLKINWYKEIVHYQNKNDISIVESFDFRCKKWTIINYDILKNFHRLPDKDNPDYVSEIDFYKFDLVIVDEAQNLSNKSDRTSLFMDFAERISNRWFLTGTPVMNRPKDFYNILSLCDSPLTDNWQYYVKRYCEAKRFNKKGGGKFWVASGASNLDELREYIYDVFSRKTKNDSLDLPPKTIKPVYLPQTDAIIYNSYMEEYREWMEEKNRLGEKIAPTEHLTKLMKVRQLLSMDKVDNTIKMVEELIENDIKVIVFSCFTNSIRTIHEYFGNKSVLVDGEVTKIKRDQAVESFQGNPKIKVFCGNIKAAGVGLTLTAGTVVIFNDLDWVPANHLQGEDRSLRIGQTQPVHVIYPLITNTIDERMYRILRDKMEVVNKVMGDGDVRIDNISILDDIIKDIVNQ